MESDWEGLWERNIRPNMGGSKMTTFFAIWQCTFCRPRGYMKTGGHHHAVKKEGVVGWAVGKTKQIGYVLTYIAKNIW